MHAWQDSKWIVFNYIISDKNVGGVKLQKGYLYTLFYILFSQGLYNKQKNTTYIA